MEPGLLLFTLLSQAPTVGGALQHVRLGQPEIKIYPVLAPQPTPRPYLCYQLIDRQPEPGSSARCRLGDVARVQLSLFADDYGTLAQLTQAVRQVLDYAEPEPGVLLEPDNQQDHHDERAQCLFRSLDYQVTLP